MHTRRNTKSAIVAFVAAPLILLSSSIVWGAGGFTAAGAVSTPIKITTCTNMKTGAMRILLQGTCKAKTERKLIWIQSPTTSSAALKCALGGTCKVGDFGPGGGVVFYVADSKQSWGTYLEAAPNSWEGGSSDPAIAWCPGFNWEGNLPTTESSLGSGSSNTSASIARCPSGAAERARAYRGGGKSDWFLPSQDELHQLYLNRAKVGGFSENCYLSSNLELERGALVSCQVLGTGQVRKGTIAYPFPVRPVRAF